ncbi:Anoctamin, partial [Brachionus plicatilis]
MWGAIFSEFWGRENNRLAYEWNVLNFEKEEINLPDYERNKEKMREKLKTSSELVKFLYTRQRYFKILLSYTVLLFMVCIICIEIGLVALFRVYIRIKVYPNDDVLGVIFGDGGSTVINVFTIMIMNRIYTFIAVSFTKWENYRTKTEYDDALIIKLFIFEFVNSYGSLFYMAFFRTIEYENGLFNLGKEYQDKCDNDNCMALLSIQLLVVFIVNPLPPFFMHVILPLLQIAFRHCLWLYKSKKIVIVENDNSDRTEKKKTDQVLIYLQAEKNKARFDETINEEYKQKVILYGYIV